MIGRLHRAPVLRIGKFGVVGGSGIVVNTAVFWILTSYLQLPLVVAGWLAIESALCTNFLLNHNLDICRSAVANLRRDGVRALSPRSTRGHAG